MPDLPTESQVRVNIHPNENIDSSTINRAPNRLLQNDLKIKDWVENIELPNFGSGLAGQINAEGTWEVTADLDYLNTNLNISDGAKSLDDLDDVTSTAPANGEVLTYNTGTSQWIPAPTAESGGAVEYIGVIGTTGGVAISQTKTSGINTVEFLYALSDLIGATAIDSTLINGVWVEAKAVLDTGGPANFSENAVIAVYPDGSDKTIIAASTGSAADGDDDTCVKGTFLVPVNLGQTGLTLKLKLEEKQGGDIVEFTIVGVSQVASAPSGSGGSGGSSGVNVSYERLISPQTAEQIAIGTTDVTFTSVDIPNIENVLQFEVLTEFPEYDSSDEPAIDIWNGSAWTPFRRFEIGNQIQSNNNFELLMIAPNIEGSQIRFRLVASSNSEEVKITINAVYRKSGSGGNAGSSLLRYGELIDFGNVNGLPIGALAVSGDFASATKSNVGSNPSSTVAVVFSTPLTTTDYNCLFEIISKGSVDLDNNILYPVVIDGTKALSGFSFNIDATASTDLQFNVRVVSNVRVGGTVKNLVTKTTGPVTINEFDNVVLNDTTAADIVNALPQITTANHGRCLTLKNIGTGSNALIPTADTTNPDTIEQASTFTFAVSASIPDGAAPTYIADNDSNTWWLI